MGLYRLLKLSSKAKLTLNCCRTATVPYIGSNCGYPGRKGCTMTIATGDKLPEVKLTLAGASGPEPVQSSDYFKGKRVALFSVPGAFTPTCSAKHLPGFVEKAKELKAKGIDEIACTAVNDAFVMGAWNKASGSDDITMLADGNGDFAKAVGLVMDGSGFGLGSRGQRFSMVVNDGNVEQLNVEAPGDFKVSSAEHMLSQL
jgi:peroxiredoxin